MDVLYGRSFYEKENTVTKKNKVTKISLPSPTCPLQYYTCSILFGRGSWSVLRRRLEFRPGSLIRDGAD